MDFSTRFTQAAMWDHMRFPNGSNVKTYRVICMGTSTIPSVAPKKNAAAGGRAQAMTIDLPSLSHSVIKG